MSPWDPKARKLALGVLITFSIILGRNHIIVGLRLFNVAASWSRSEAFVSLEDWKDGFDTTFKSYKVNQLTSSVPPIPEEDVVPPIIHHFGPPDHELDWNVSRSTCLDLHPRSSGWTHVLWTEESTMRFIQTSYRWYVPTYLGYVYPEQRRQAAKIFIMYHFGGFYLDIDIKCLRSLGPLRKFETLSISSPRTGLSDWFLASSPRHEFYELLVQTLRIYDLWWPIETPSLSTGRMFLSAEHLRYRPWHRRRRSLRILKYSDASNLFVIPTRRLSSSGVCEADAKFGCYAVFASAALFGCVLALIWRSRYRVGHCWPASHKV